MIRDPAAQEVCQRCGAWLPVRPDLAEFESYIRERPHPDCHHRSPTDNEVWSPFTIDNWYCDQCVLQEHIEEWRYRFSCLECGWPRERTDKRSPAVLFPAALTELHAAGQQARLEAWRLPLTLIVHVNYTACRHSYPVDAKELAGRASLLDHEGRRVARWGSVYEDTFGDPHKVRLALARLRHARRDGEEARAAWLLCERAVLAVNLVYATAPSLAEPLWAGDPNGPFVVAPVLGGGGLSIEGRYRAWMQVHHGYPWLFDPAEEWHDRLRRRFAGLPDPEVPAADLPRHLLPLWQFVDVADDLMLYKGRCRRGARRERERAGVQLRATVFMALSRRGELDRRLPYEPIIREPGYVPDYQRGSERQFI